MTLADDGLAFGNEGTIPKAAVLVGKQYQLAAEGGASGSTRLDEQHECEQALDLELVGHQLDQHPSKADGFGAKVLADQPVARGGRVALVEDEIDHRQHSLKPTGEISLIWNSVGDARGADLRFGSNQPLRQGGLRHEKGVRNFRSCEPSQKPKRQTRPARSGRARGGSR